ncbi:MAG: hypothetical protein EP330_20710 [Deltaproteobacteria bacterium]|nr:MAG: hypothetical protein EP330_20710 [Deltaproteobacteria bacterium]
MNNLRALFWLTVTLVQRLSREGMIVRSLVFPTTLVIGTLLATLAVMAAIQSPSTVAMVPGDPASALVDEAGFTVVETETPREAVERRMVWAAVVGDDIVTRNETPELRRLESMVREARGSAWRPASAVLRPSNVESRPWALRIARLLAVLFTLYGGVFGAGMLARDREDGTLESELSMPIARWVPATARFVAGSAGLGLFFAGGVLLVDAVLDLAEPLTVIGHGVAASAGATAVGLASAGNATLKSGFSTTLAFSMTGITALGSVGLSNPNLHFLPIASLSSEGSPVVPLMVALGFGLASSAWFAWRAK